MYIKVRNKLLGAGTDEVSVAVLIKKSKKLSLKKRGFKDNFKTFKEADIFRRPSIKFFFYSNKIDILLSFKSSFTQLYTILHMWKINVQNSNKYLKPLY